MLVFWSVLLPPLYKSTIFYLSHSDTRKSLLSVHSNRVQLEPNKGTLNGLVRSLFIFDLSFQSKRLVSFLLVSNPWTSLILKTMSDSLLSRHDICSQVVARNRYLTDVSRTHFKVPGHPLSTRSWPTYFWSLRRDWNDYESKIKSRVFTVRNPTPGTEFILGMTYWFLFGVI